MKSFAALLACAALLTATTGLYAADEKAKTEPKAKQETAVNKDELKKKLTPLQYA